MCYCGTMGKMIQVRNVPAKLHAELTRRARKKGISLTEYVESILRREVARPPVEELYERIKSRPPIEIGEPIAEMIRRERARRPK